jgi:hypothetical protein
LINNERKKEMTINTKKEKTKKISPTDELSINLYNTISGNLLNK